MNVSIPPVFAQAILGAVTTWITYCQECCVEIGDPVLDRNDLVETIRKHAETHK